MLGTGGGALLGRTAHLVFVFGSLFGLWFLAPCSVSRLSKGLDCLFQLAALRYTIYALLVLLVLSRDWGWEVASRLLLPVTSSFVVEVCHALAAHGSFFFSLAFLAGCCRRCVYADGVRPARSRCVHRSSRVLLLVVQALLPWVAVFILCALLGAACAGCRLQSGYWQA